MPTETNINSINLFQTQAAYEDNKTSLSENDLVAVAIGDSLIPVGTIISYAGNATPNGFLDCSGASLSPSTYTNLFGVIGTTYGGDGSTTFNLPNLNNNSFLEGSNTAGTVKSAGLPNATGKVDATGGGGEEDLSRTGATYTSTGALNAIQNDSTRFSGYNSSSGTYWRALELDLSKSNPIYGKSDTVQPKSVTVKFCIKY